MQHMTRLQAVGGATLLLYIYFKVAADKSSSVDKLEDQMERSRSRFWLNFTNMVVPLVYGAGVFWAWRAIRV